MKVCITGASSGIGRSLTSLLVSRGHTVWAIARREAELKQLKEELQSNRFFYSACDVSNTGQILKVKAEMQKNNFIPDAVVVGAAVFLDDIHPQFNITAAKQVLDINLGGALNTVDAFLNDFIKQKHGHFIALSSIAAFRPNQRGIAYPASKSALGILWRGLQLAHLEKNVVFSTIYLGPVATPMWEGKKDSFLVISEKDAANRIAKLLEKPKPIAYIPYLSTAVYRLLGFLPDQWFVSLGKLIK